MFINEHVNLTSKLKEKCKTATKNEKVKIISLFPDYWSRGEINKKFDVSECFVCQTRELVKEQNILSNLFKRVSQVIWSSHKMCSGILWRWYKL